MTGDFLTNLLMVVTSVALAIVYLGPAPDADGGRWHASWPVKVLNGVAMVCSIALIIKVSIGMPVAQSLLGMFPAVVLVGVAYSIGRRRRRRRLAAGREVERMSEPRPPELTG